MITCAGLLSNGSQRRRHVMLVTYLRPIFQPNSLLKNNYKITLIKNLYNNQSQLAQKPALQMTKKSYIQQTFTY